MVTETDQNEEKIVCFNMVYMELSKKWALILIKDLFMGCRKFNDFLRINPLLNNKVLSDQLKRLEEYGYIAKKVVSITPLKAEYELTKMGQDLNKLVYEKLKFALKYGLMDKNLPEFKTKSLEEIFNIEK